MKKVFEVDQICQACNGTGLYVGIAERDGAAVVCHSCKGSGKYHFKHTYEEFDRRHERRDIVRVYQTNPGIVIGTKGKDETFRLEDFGGMPYKEWAQGLKFPTHSENRKFTCPAWWYQSVDYDKKPHWKECIGIGSFSHCSMFDDKAMCWMKWDKEFGGQ